MEAATFERWLMEGLRKKSGLEARRNYLGMSGIGQCARKLYFEYVEGRPAATDRDHWHCWTGYLHEGAVGALMGFRKEEIEVVAGFDERFRGHVDYVLPLAERDTLVEIKSTGWQKFEKIRRGGPDEWHKAQVQMYLRHGDWEQALLVYVARDVDWRAWDWIELPLLVFTIEPDEALADELDRKARDILAAIDRGVPPRSGCGMHWCRYCHQELPPTA